MKVIIPAGGKATRLYPTTLLMPKHLINIAGKPIIYYVLRHCWRNGLDGAIICVSSDKMKKEFENAVSFYSDSPNRVSFSVTSEQFGSGKRIQKAAEEYGLSEFVVYYGDILTNFDLKSMIEFHHLKDATCTIATTINKEVEFGVVYEDQDGRVKRFLEHPKIKEISAWSANAGIAVCKSDILRYDISKSADFFKDIIPLVVLNNSYSVYSFRIGDYIDIGTFSSIEKAKRFIR